MHKLWHFFTDESATAAVEYGVIVGLIGLGLITTLQTVGSQLGSILDALSSALNAPPPGNSGNGA
jgi:Flp pilus assembly pilin Flp